MTQEEKAKAYDEAIEKAKSMHEQGMMPERLEYIFPELKESEDDRIRKALIEFLKKASGGFLDTTTQCKTFGKWLAWLEKQGEHGNFRNKIQIGDKVTRNRDGVLVNLSQLNRVAKKDEKQGKQKPNYNNKELKDVVIAELNKYNSNGLNAPWATDSTGLQYPLYFANLGAKWQEEQKPAWSEEDESLRRRCIGAIDMANLSDYTKDNLLNWLKSLKDRLQLQPKPAWSEEDEEKMNWIIATLNNCSMRNSECLPMNESCEDWLKSLRPQNRWKPSYKQMEALWSATEKYLESDNENVRKLRGEVLESLYEDLKKLTEE